MEMLKQLNGAHMVAVSECWRCDFVAVAYWHGGATVNYSVFDWGGFLWADLWTNYDLEKLPLSQVEQILRLQLRADMCKCLTRDLHEV